MLEERDDVLALGNGESGWVGIASYEIVEEGNGDRATRFGHKYYCDEEAKWVMV